MSTDQTARLAELKAISDRPLTVDEKTEVKELEAIKAKA